MSAIISDCGLYRYELRRKLGGYGPPCLFIMLNPSTADAEQDDPTIRRCMGFAKSFGCGELIVVNLFAYRATSPKAMMAANDPVGEKNKDYVMAAADETIDPLGGPGVIVCAWGQHGNHIDQGETVVGWLEGEDYEMYCLGTTKDGSPKHPLYLRSDSKLIEYRGKS